MPGEPPRFAVRRTPATATSRLLADRYPFSPKRSYTPGPATVDDLVDFEGRIGMDRCVLVQPSVYGADNAACWQALGRLGRPGERRRGDRPGADERSGAWIELRRAGRPKHPGEPGGGKGIAIRGRPKRALDAATKRVSPREVRASRSMRACPSWRN